MHADKIQKWLNEASNRRDVLSAFTQPMTATQISRRLGLPLGVISYTIETLKIRHLLFCLNPDAHISRVYYLTDLGVKYYKSFCHEENITTPALNFHEVDWRLYGWACFSQRRLVLKYLDKPMRITHLYSYIRCKTDIRDRVSNSSGASTLSMSKSNIRGVLQAMLKKGIVKKILLPRETYPFYQLTDTGKAIRDLLK